MRDVIVTLYNSNAQNARISSSFVGPGGAWQGGGLPVDTIVPANNGDVLMDTLRLTDTCQFAFQVTIGDGTAANPFRILAGYLDAERVPVMELPEEHEGDESESEEEQQPIGETWLINARGDASMAPLVINAGFDDGESAAVFQIQ